MIERLSSRHKATLESDLASRLAIEMETVRTNAASQQKRSDVFYAALLCFFKLFKRFVMSSLRVFKASILFRIFTEVEKEILGLKHQIDGQMKEVGKVFVR